MDLDGAAPRHARTERLLLDALTPDDVGDVDVIGRSLEDVWWSFPPPGTTGAGEVADLVRLAAAAWDRDGLGYWMVRDPGAHIVLGVGGCSQLRAPAWSLYYRMRLSAQGQGLAGELVASAQEWAAVVDPTLPVTAVLEERNVRAAAVVQRAGLSVVHREAHPPPMGGRLVYADREVPARVVEALLGPLPDASAPATTGGV